MFYNDLINMHNEVNPGAFCDPLDEPDNPALMPLRLERYHFVDRYGLDPEHEEERLVKFQLFKRYWPKWLRWDMNPTDRMTWSLIRKDHDPYDKREAYTRYIKEMEVAIYEGHERVLIQPRYIGDYAADWIRVGEHCHYYALNYGITGLLSMWRYPKAWWFWIPMTYISLINAYCYSRYWRTDRFYRYRIFEPEVFDDGDTMPVVRNVDELRVWPKHYFILKRVGRVKATLDYLRNQTAAICCAFMCCFRMAQLERHHEYYRIMKANLKPFNNCEYYLPAFMDFNQFWVDPLPRNVYKKMLTWRWGVTADQWCAMILLTFFTWDFYQSLAAINEPPKDKSGKDYALKVQPKNESIFKPLG